MSENRKYSNMAIRFDVIFLKNDKISGGYQVTHLASAFPERV